MRVAEWGHEGKRRLRLSAACSAFGLIVWVVCGRVGGVRNVLKNCQLYGIVDRGYTRREDIAAATRELIAGGVRVLQLRAKKEPLEAVRQMAREMMSICRGEGALFVLNDYPEMAAELGADAVHVGQDAPSLAALRRIVGEEMVVGRSTHSLEQARAARAEGVDYIGFGPLFPTGTKPGRPAIGLQDIAAVQQRVDPLPVFCIGGINGATLPRVREAGARRVVIVSWLLQQADRAEAARAVLRFLGGKN